MTDEQLQTVEAFKAWLQKKPIQYRMKHTPPVDWEDSTEVRDWKEWCEYRPKPGPRLRPWTRAEVPLGAEVIHNRTGQRSLIIGISGDLHILLCEHKLRAEDLLRDWLLLNGDPCGAAE